MFEIEVCEYDRHVIHGLEIVRENLTKLLELQLLGDFSIPNRQTLRDFKIFRLQLKTKWEENWLLFSYNEFGMNKTKQFDFL